MPKSGSTFVISGQIEHDAQICNLSKLILHLSHLGIKPTFGSSDLLLFSFSPSVCKEGITLCPTVVMCKIERNEHLMDQVEQRQATQQGHRGVAGVSAPTVPGSLQRAALPLPPTQSRYGDSLCHCPSPP